MTNMITLQLKRPHLSIPELNGVSLPSLAIICGLNGSGKTHLLNAIASGAVELVKDGRILKTSAVVGPMKPEIELTASYSLPRGGQSYPWDRI